MRLVCLIGACVLALQTAFAQPPGYWRFEGDLAGGEDVAGKAGVFEKGAPPVFDASAPAAKIWDGATFAPANPADRSALRFVNEPVGGAGGPVGGEVAVNSADAKLHLADLTIEAFVKMGRQSPRHALIASQRRNGQNGATWSLSIDPQGCVRARFDTQPGTDSKGEGFNQSFGSSGSVADGAWHHVALTFEHATRSAAIYVDHVRCGGGGTKGPLVYDGSPLIFGRGLDGWLDEVRMTGAALHPEQFLRPTRFFAELKPRAPAIMMLDQTPTRVQTALKLEWKKLGTLKPKSVDEVGSSTWSLGCETLDRDLADWDAYKNYLQPLGIRHIRLQGGWNKTEKQKGVYDFAWLDHIVDDATSLGLKICLETSYGNRIYEPQAALGPGGRLPEGEETLAAWDKWIEAMARRYTARGVVEWMMYNEPNLTKSNTVEKTAEFNIRTAKIIKCVNPQARIAGLVSAGASAGFVGGFLRGLKEQGQLDLFTWVVYHHYSANPDATYDKVEELQKLLNETAPRLRLWQGEAGCASEEVQFALSGVDWTELSQAKWDARRMLGDLGRDIRSSVFTISDLAYHKDFISRYGLLKTNPDNSLIKVKMAYYVVQNIVSVFNGAVQRVPDYSLEARYARKLAWFAFRDKNTGLDLVTFWDCSAVPNNEVTTATARLIIKHGHFKEPVWVDLLTGNLYAIPTDNFTIKGDACEFRDVPVCDAPALLTDKSLLLFVPARQNKK